MTLKQKFSQLKKENKKAFNVYFPFGFPELALTPDIFFVLQDSGVDIVELGFPFSDPLADGPIIQQACAAALKQNINLGIFFQTIQKMKNKIKIPVVVMSYCNPVFKYGLEKFFHKLSENKIAGTILVDLPLEESQKYLSLAKKFQIDPIFFITPVTPLQRSREIIKKAAGFIYYISVTGVTGPRRLDLGAIASDINQIKKISNIPVCVGFGIHNRSQVKKISAFSDGVIVGSQIVKFIGQNYKNRDFLKKLAKKVKELKCTK